jgi:hypothetical protein
MFLGWYDPDPKKAAHLKVREGVARYVEKFGRYPSMCLTSPVDAEELTQALRGHLPLVRVESRARFARHTYYIGEDAGEIEGEVT